MKINGDNERVKRRYFRYMLDAKRQSAASIDQAAAALDRFEDFTKRRNFKAFRIEQASAFKDNLAAQDARASGRPLSAATQLHILNALRGFFIWLADQPGFRRIKYSDADYFNLSHKQIAVAKAERHKEGPTVEQVRHVITNMPTDSSIELRNRAVLSLALLTGARDNALASLRLKHIDIDKRMIVQDARDVRTKASKTITTWFVPVGDDLVKIVAEWVTHLRNDHLYGPDDSLFPKTRVGLGPSRRLEPLGLERACWSTASPIRETFRNAFTSAGLPYFHPHLLRKTLARLGMSICKTHEQMKAWSQNIGHDGVLTTLKSYGHVEHVRQRELIASLWQPKSVSDDAGEVLRQVRRLLQDRIAG